MTEQPFVPAQDFVLKAEPQGVCPHCGHAKSWKCVLSTPDGKRVDQSTNNFESKDQALFCGELAFRNRGILKVEGERVER